MNTSRERLARRAAEMLRDGMAGSIPKAIGQACAARRRLSAAQHRTGASSCGCHGNGTPGTGGLGW